MNSVHVKGNTHYLESRQLLIPYYILEDGGCVLFDSGRESDRAPVEAFFLEAGIPIRGILLTHMHYDHNENSRYFREKYQIPIGMSRGEGEICRSVSSVKNHLFNFSMGTIRNTKRLQNILTPVDRFIEDEEREVTFCGCTFGVIPTPGHSPFHLAFRTPDDVCILGDALLSGEVIEAAHFPFVFDLEIDFATKEGLRDLKASHYILSHMTVETDLTAVIDQNLAVQRERIRNITSWVTEPITFCDFYGLLNEKIGKTAGHPISHLHQERYYRPYLEYLIDNGTFCMLPDTGRPNVAPGHMAP